jgi:hypothetical protein
MRELQTCDFCGADPVGVYEPLPASLASDQPRVALCADCRDTLRRVLAPLDGADAVPADPEPSTTTEPADATPTTNEPSASAESAESGDEGVTIDRSASSGGDADGAPTDGASAAAKRPPGYAQVLRLVRNRDDALERDALESLASSAYDVSAAEVRQAIDAAVENGDLEETDAGIRAA